MFDPFNNQENQETPKEYYSFYDIKEGKNGSYIEISYYKLVQLLFNLGYRRYDKSGEVHIIRIQDNIADIVDTAKIIDEVEKYINLWNQEVMPDGANKITVINKLYKGLSSYFSTMLLYRLRPDNPIQFNVHTQHKAFFYYRNGFVEITKDEVRLRPYKELDKLIWRNQILQRDFVPSGKDEGVFFKFCNNIADNYHNKGLNRPNNPNRFRVFKSIIGKLLHSYFEGKNKAVLLTDARMTQEADGRSGKTLLGQALGKILNCRDDGSSTTYLEISGKDFDESDRFKWQELNLDSQLVHLNDVQQNFDFECLFNDITEGIKVQRKNMNPYNIRANIMISSNKTVRIHGGSARDRVVEFELADYYSDTFSPADEFKQWFFRDWNEKEWGKFDNFLMNCVQYYLNTGLQKPGEINLSARKLLEETNIDFLNFMNEKELISGIWYAKKDDLYIQFIAQNDHYRKLGIRKFYAWIRTFCMYDNTVIKFEEKRSNNKDLIRFFIDK